MSWTKEWLETLARSRMAGAKLIVVSNREPYIHRRQHGEAELMRPAGGLTTALDPVMQACGGVWVAHGSGDADRMTADATGRIAVPPGEPSYTLRRVWLNEAEELGYYYGLANSTLWPLCHQVYRQPTFDPAHWAVYREVNALFAETVLEEAEGGPAVVFVQDYHFALLPRMLKNARPDLVVAQFWHIPWPNTENFRVCPWASELLDGMLGNDLLGFHIQNHCNNFLETVDRIIESRVCREEFSVSRKGQTTRVRPFPISVDPGLARDYLGDTWKTRVEALRSRYQLARRPLIVGVDRVDYTKGIPERLRAVEWLLQHHPEWVGGFHFVQLGAPSRTVLPEYQWLNDEILGLANRINRMYGNESWQPVVFVNEHCEPRDIYPLYREAAGCVVSSLHDGMNLVAKEFITARDDEQGVLVLSEFAGAARELTDAILVNPFDVEKLAAGIHSALTMPAEEQQRRMRRMRAHIDDNNIYRWAGMFLQEVYKLVDDSLQADGSPANSPQCEGAREPQDRNATRKYSSRVLKYSA
jgi:trehalose 6-phosphate synthase